MNLQQQPKVPQQKHIGSEHTYAYSEPMYKYSEFTSNNVRTENVVSQYKHLVSGAHIVVSVSKQLVS